MPHKGLTNKNLKGGETMSTNRHEGCKRQFSHLSRAWYGDVNLATGAVRDSVTMGYYHPGGGTTGEFTMSWRYIGGKLTPRLDIYEDSWEVMWLFSDVLESLSHLNGTNPSPTEIAALLVSCGIEDATPTKSPYGQDKSGQEMKERQP